MSTDIRVAVVGLDTSHSIEFVRRMQAPDCPADQKVEGMRAVTCMRFETPFQDKQGLDDRQKQLEEWGVKVTEDVQEAIADCDAIMLEINDPAYHVEYFKKCAGAGKPVFLDKPLAANLEEAKVIVDIAKKNNTKVFSSSSLRYSAQLIEAAQKVSNPQSVMVYGPLGIAPAGSSIVWYGVHSFEMLVRCIGTGACKLTAVETGSSVVSVVEYKDGRKGIVDLTKDAWAYGGTLRGESGVASFEVEVGNIYTEELREIAAFFAGGAAPVSLEETMEVVALLEATDVSVSTGKSQNIDF